MNNAFLAEHINRRLPNFGKITDVNKLVGGTINHVWRVYNRTQSIIIKKAEYSTSSMPNFQLNTNRISFETRAMKLFDVDQPLYGISSEKCRPPKVIDFAPDNSTLIEEDAGSDRLALDSLILSDKVINHDIFEDLGIFIGQLHKETFADKSLASSMDNKEIQLSRAQSQYQSLGNSCEAANIKSYQQISNKLIKLGESFLKPGKCLTMGDLWPRSLLIDFHGIRIIDWEFAHFGKPAQDLGHLLAHLWMIKHHVKHLGHSKCASQSDEIQQTRLRNITLLTDNFIKAYMKIFGDNLTQTDFEETATHFGAEILTRTIGKWQQGYLFDGINTNSETFKTAINISESSILSPLNSKIIKQLQSSI